MPNVAAAAAWTASDALNGALVNSHVRDEAARQQNTTLHGELDEERAFGRELDNANLDLRRQIRTLRTQLIGRANGTSMPVGPTDEMLRRLERLGQNILARIKGYYEAMDDGSLTPGESISLASAAWPAFCFFAWALYLGEGNSYGAIGRVQADLTRDFGSASPLVLGSAAHAQLAYVSAVSVTQFYHSRLTVDILQERATNARLYYEQLRLALNSLMGATIGQQENMQLEGEEEEEEEEEEGEEGEEESAPNTRQGMLRGVGDLYLDVSKTISDQLKGALRRAKAETVYQGIEAMVQGEYTEPQEWLTAAGRVLLETGRACPTHAAERVELYHKLLKRISASSEGHRTERRYPAGSGSSVFRALVLVSALRYILQSVSELVSVMRTRNADIDDFMKLLAVTAGYPQDEAIIAGKSPICIDGIEFDSTSIRQSAQTHFDRFASALTFALADALKVDVDDNDDDADVSFGGYDELRAQMSAKAEAVPGLPLGDRAREIRRATGLCPPQSAPYNSRRGRLMKLFATIDANRQPQMPGIATALCETMATVACASVMPSSSGSTRYSRIAKYQGMPNVSWQPNAIPQGPKGYQYALTVFAYYRDTTSLPPWDSVTFDGLGPAIDAYVNGMTE